MRVNHAIFSFVTISYSKLNTTAWLWSTQTQAEESTLCNATLLNVCVSPATKPLQFYWRSFGFPNFFSLLRMCAVHVLMFPWEFLTLLRITAQSTHPELVLCWFHSAYIKNVTNLCFHDFFWFAETNGMVSEIFYKNVHEAQTRHQDFSVGAAKSHKGGGHFLNRMLDVCSNRYEKSRL